MPRHTALAYTVPRGRRCVGGVRRAARTARDDESGRRRGVDGRNRARDHSTARAVPLLSIVRSRGGVLPDCCGGGALLLVIEGASPWAWPGYIGVSTMTPALQETVVGAGPFFLSSKAPRPGLGRGASVYRP